MNLRIVASVMKSLAQVIIGEDLSWPSLPPLLSEFIREVLNLWSSVEHTIARIV